LKSFFSYLHPLSLLWNRLRELKRLVKSLKGRRKEKKD
jgi:hypothetical protein